MNLRYIVIYMDYDSGFKDPFRDKFNLESRFISNYLSVQIRKLRIKTDGTFNMISIALSNEMTQQCRIVGEKSLQARIFFDKEKYTKLSIFEKFNYCLQLLEEGYKVCALNKQIPLEQLTLLHKQLMDNDYKNEWLHKKRRFKEHGIEVSLNCIFSSTDFQLKVNVNDINTKSELVSGTLIKTLPDELCFEKLFKDVIIEGNELIITEYQNRPKFKFKLSDLFDNNFSFEATDVGLEYKPLD